MRNFSFLVLCAVLAAGAFQLTAAPVLADGKAPAAGRAAGAAAAAPLAPGKAAGTNKAQAVREGGGFLIVGLGGLVIAGAVLVVSGGGGGAKGGEAAPRNFSMTASGTAS